MSTKCIKFESGSHLGWDFIACLIGDLVNFDDFGQKREMFQNVSLRGDSFLSNVDVSRGRSCIREKRVIFFAHKRY